MSGVSFNKTWNYYPKHNQAERFAKTLGWDGNGGDKEILEFLEAADPMDIVNVYEGFLTVEVSSR